MDFQQLLAKLGRSGQVAVGGALLIFVFSFLPWWSFSVSFLGESISGHASAWNAGIGAWFPVLLLLASGVVTLLVALDVVKWAPLMLWTLNTAAAAVSVIIIVLRWVTFPSSSATDAISGGSSSAGAGYALYVSLVLAIAMGVFGYLGFTGVGGSVSDPMAGFKGGAAPAQVPPGQFPPQDYGQQYPPQGQQYPPQ
jgi:hypothetical protein